MCHLLFLFIITFTLEIHCFPTLDALHPTDLNLIHHVIQSQILIAILLDTHTFTIHVRGTPVLATFLSEDKIRYWRPTEIPRSSEIPCKCKETIYKCFLYSGFVRQINKGFSKSI